MKRNHLTGSLKSLFVFIWLAFTSTTFAQTARYYLEDPLKVASILDTIIAKRMERYHIPGFSMSIVKDGKIFISKGYGIADLETKTPVSAETIFRIGSVTKLFTAMAMMQLVDEGKINLNDDVNKYIINKIAYKNNIPVTPHHLLSHSEGFREIPNRRTSSAAKIHPLDVFLKDRLVQDHYAGELAAYNTYGLALSGLLLENISGMPYRDYLSEKIFGPLQMDHSNATDIPGNFQPLFATGYEYKDSKYKKMDFEYYHTFPASDINSTANDMANFMIAHLNNGKFKSSRVLSEASAIKMRSTQFRNHPQVVGFGYGFWESTINGTRSVWHGGVMDGYSSYLYLFPEQNIGIFLVCNREASNFLGSILNNFLYYFFPEPPQPNDRPEPSLKMNLEQFAGSYQRPGLPKMEIRLNTDSTLSFWGGKWLQVKPNLFRCINGNLDTGEDLIAFKQNADGEIAYMTTGTMVYFRLDLAKSK